jgi:hypothetical protein
MQSAQRSSGLAAWRCTTVTASLPTARPWRCLREEFHDRMLAQPGNSIKYRLFGASKSALFDELPLANKEELVAKRDTGWRVRGFAAGRIGCCALGIRMTFQHTFLWNC